jgi:hypothetical protein
MIIQDVQFLLENTEDHYDVVNNASRYAKTSGKVFLLCKADGILSSGDATAKELATDYFKSILVDEQEFYTALFESESKCVLLEFRDPKYAQFFAQNIFMFKNQVDIPEKYVYCGVFIENGGISFENYKAPFTEKGPTIKDIFTEEEIENYLNGQIT